ncbi:MAG: aspartate aminotransferase family protein [Granulosicoccaceae bacterium]
MSALMTTYSPLSISLSHGEGAWVWDEDGNRYLDGFGGIAVTALGHAHPRITRAIAEQAHKIIHCSNIFTVSEQEKTGQALCDISGMERVFFCNSGAEANEAALKIARLHARTRDIAKPKVIVMEQSFHGRTIATLSATGNAKVHAGFEPLVEGFVRVPFNDLQAIEAAAKEHTDIVAILVEPIQGEGGIHVPAPAYLEGLRSLCDQHNWLLMLDEIQCGMGRTGKWFAYQNTSALPDVVSVAKALGNGVPIGACMARGAAAELMQPGNHGTTFGGNPLSCRVASEVIAVMQEQNLPARAKELGERMIGRLRDALDDVPTVVEVRGLGLMIGIELDRDPNPAREAAARHGALVTTAGGNVLRLLPPYILSDDDADSLVDKVAEALRAEQA